MNVRVPIIWAAGKGDKRSFLGGGLHTWKLLAEDTDGAFFLFEDDLIVTERIYFDSATMLRQLGLAHDPQKLPGRLTTALTHPITVGGAYGRAVLARIKGGKR